MRGVAAIGGAADCNDRALVDNREETAPAATLYKCNRQAPGTGTAEPSAPRAGGPRLCVRELGLRQKQQFGGHDDGQVQGQGGDADGGAGMLPDSGAEDVDDELGEAVDDGRGRGVAGLCLDEAGD
jgi:hypothetical protein